MPVLNKGLLEFHPTTVQDVRKEFNLDKPGTMDEAIDILHQWIQKQEHFVKKNFCREYMERVIISTKGSVERAKARVDKICTLRTTAPEIFTKVNAKQEFPNLTQWYTVVYMPKLTEDNYRILVIQIKSKITSSILLDAYRHTMIFHEYVKRNDYAQGVIVILDLRGNNIMEFVSEIKILDFNNFIVLCMEGFGFRVKNIFVISESKVIHLFSNILKRVLSAKVGERIMVLRTMDELQNQVPIELLPEDFGGHQKSIKKLYDEWTEELSSEEHVAYVKEMTQACTNESLRVSDELCDDQHGLPGTFKILPVD